VISVFLLDRETVAKTLREKGCQELESPIPEHSAWRSPWDESFFVPEVGPDRMTPAWTLEEIIESVDKSKPDCH
jgi:hypothetical protein